MDFAKYKTRVEWPDKNKFKTYYYYKRGKLVATKVGAGVPEGLPDNCTSDYELDEAGYKAAYTAYRDADRAAYEMFKSDLFAELGIENNPKRDLLFSKAWEDGHSEGFSGVYNSALDLVDLIE